MIHISIKTRHMLITKTDQVGQITLILIGLKLLTKKHLQQNIMIEIHLHRDKALNLVHQVG